MFAMRDIPQDNVGFTPFELLLWQECAYTNVIIEKIMDRRRRRLWSEDGIPIRDRPTGV